MLRALFAATTLIALAIPAAAEFKLDSRYTDTLLIFVVPKYRAGASLPATASEPLILGAPSFAAKDFKDVIDFSMRGSACAKALLIRIDGAARTHNAKTPLKCFHLILNSS